MDERRRPGPPAAVARVLENRLADAGLDVVDPAERLRCYQAVENTYLSTFQALGVLGLVLGTLGLGAVLSATSSSAGARWRCSPRSATGAPACACSSPARSA